MSPGSNLPRNEAFIPNRQSKDSVTTCAKVLKKKQADAWTCDNIFNNSKHIPTEEWLNMAERERPPQETATAAIGAYSQGPDAKPCNFDL